MTRNPAEHVLRTIDDAHIDGHGVYLTEGDVALLWDEILRLRRISYHAKARETELLSERTALSRALAEAVRERDDESRRFDELETERATLIRELDQATLEARAVAVTQSLGDVAAGTSIVGHIAR